MCCGGHTHSTHRHHSSPHSGGHSCCCGHGHHTGFHSHTHGSHHSCCCGKSGHHSHHGHSHHSSHKSGHCCCCCCCCCCSCDCEGDEDCECEDEAHQDWEEMDEKEAIARLEDYLMELQDEIETVEEHLEALK